MKKLARTLMMAAALGLAVPAAAGWRKVDAGETREVARGSLVVVPGGEWNRSTQRPSKRSEAWTRDGMLLNDLTFYGKVKKGEALFRETSRKRRPLPHFDPAMLPSDIVEWYEDTANIVLGGSLFTVTEVRPAKLAGYDGVHFAYSYTGQDNVERKGEVRAAIIAEKLYLIAFDAPRLHYFDQDIAEVRAIMDGARLK